MVRQVECLGSKLHVLVLTNLELPGQAHVDPDASRTLNVAPAHVPILARCRTDEGRRVEVQIDTLIRGVRTGKNLILKRY